jgi:drug/metabolite transporter (DMT)-like permease
MALVSGTAVQYTASGLIFLLLALSTETMEVRWTLQLVATLGWMVFGMSFGAVSLLLLLIRRSSVSRVSSYLYLVPPLTALEAYLLFDERLTALALVGMAAVAVGVALVVVTRKVDGR